MEVPKNLVVDQQIRELAATIPDRTHTRAIAMHLADAVTSLNDVNKQLAKALRDFAGEDNCHNNNELMAAASVFNLAVKAVDRHVDYLNLLHTIQDFENHIDPDAGLITRSNAFSSATILVAQEMLRHIDEAQATKDSLRRAMSPEAFEALNAEAEAMRKEVFGDGQ